MIKAVFLDAIDTLFGPYPDKIGMYQRAIKKISTLDIPREKMQKVWDKIVTDTEDVAARKLSKDGSLAWDGFNMRIMELLGYKGDLKRAGEDLLFEAWSNPDNFVLYDDVIPTLDYLKSKGIKIYCASNENEELNNFFIHFGISKYFEKVFTSEKLGVEKPNPRFFETILKETDYSPDEVIHVGDSLVSDCLGAHRAGIKSVLIDRDNKIKDNEGINRVDNLIKINRFLEV